MTGHGDEGPSEPPGHVLDEPRLPAAGRALEHDRQPSHVALLEDGDFVSRREIERGVRTRIAKAVVTAAVRDAVERGWCGGVVVAHAGVGAACAAASLCTRCRGARKKKSHKNSTTPAVKRMPVPTSVRKCTWIFA